jgi:hypothetical protein
MDEAFWQEAYWQRVTRKGKAACLLACGDCDGPVEAHHVVPKQRVKHWLGFMEIAPEDLWPIVWDDRNGVPLCRDRHHHLVTVGALKLPAWKVPLAVYDFAAQYDLGWSLDRDLDYP